MFSFWKTKDKKKTPDMFLGISSGSIFWVTTSYLRDIHGRMIITGQGNFATDVLLKKSSLPVDFVSAVKKHTVHMIAPSGSITRYIVPELFSQTQLQKNTDYVIHQTMLLSNNHNTLYETTSCNMQKITPVIEQMKQLGIKIKHIHHIGDGYARMNIISGISSYYIISLGNDVSWVSWVADGRVLYQQDISLGKNTLIDIITRHVGIDKGEAVRILEKYGITGQHPDRGILGLLHHALSPIIDTIREWQMIHSKYRYIPEPFQVIPKLIGLTGSGSIIPGIEQYLVIGTGIPVEHVQEQILQGFTCASHNRADLEPYESILSLIDVNN